MYWIFRLKPVLVFLAVMNLNYFCRYRELEEKLDYLQKSSAQRDKTEALLKQKEKDFSQV